MTGFDKTGSEGRGPMTGRKMGRCTNFGKKLRNTVNTLPGGQDEKPTESIPGRGFGFGWRRRAAGRRRGLGRQNRFRGGF